MTGETMAAASGSEDSWNGVERRRTTSAPKVPAETFLPVPADWQSRGLAFLADLLIYTGLLFGARHFLGEILSGFLAMVYIVFRDGLFGGQSIGKKILGIRVVHMDGRPISYVDSSFRNVLFIFYPIYALTAAVIVVETLVSLRDPQRRRLGDRIAKTCVVRKEGVPVLA
ncbi:MAG TPA: RDD family protein [Candidatus Deferrimicrobium sp.]